MFLFQLFRSVFLEDCSACQMQVVLDFHFIIFECARRRLNKQEASFCCFPIRVVAIGMKFVWGGVTLWSGSVVEEGSRKWKWGSGSHASLSACLLVLLCLQSHQALWVSCLCCVGGKKNSPFLPSNSFPPSLLSFAPSPPSFSFLTLTYLEFTWLFRLKIVISNLHFPEHE